MSNHSQLEQELNSLGAELRLPPSIAEAVMRKIARDDRDGIALEECVCKASPNNFVRGSLTIDLGATLRSAPRGYRWTSAMASLLLILWFGAQTAAWGQVARNLQQTAIAESSVITSPSNPPQEFGAVMRFVLLVHVFSLLGGMLGLMVVWMRSHWDWLLSIGRPTKVPHRTGKIHVFALSLYGLGIVLGSCWSQATFGTPWRWDPREAFALLTLCAGVVWFQSVDEVPNTSFPQVIRRAVIAALSFGLIMVMQGLAIPYSRKSQSYGFPTTILILLITNLVALYASRWWFAKRQIRGRI